MTDLKTGVADIAEATLADQQFVTPIDVLVGMDWLAPKKLSLWLGGFVTPLDRCLRVDRADAVRTLDALAVWAQDRGLTPWDTDYAGLRFTAANDPGIERIFRTRWAQAEIPAPKPPPYRSEYPKVRAAPHAWECVVCERPGDLLLAHKDGGICPECAGIGHLVFLPSGDTSLTRRTKKASRLSSEVLRMNTRRYRYERQGILTEQRAIEIAAQQCLADPAPKPLRGTVDEQLRQEIADIIRAEFPGCPTARAEAIAYYAAVRGRDRRARARVLTADSVRWAVTDSVRRIDTAYEDLLLTGSDRDDAEQHVQAAIDRILHTWRSGATVLD